LLIEGRATQAVVKEGTLGGTGTLEHLTVRDGGTVAPGAPIGVLTIEDSFTMHAGATLEFDINGTDNSDPLNAQYDQLVVGGDFHSAGTLKVTLFDDGDRVFSPVQGESFELLVAADGLIGPFHGFDLPPLAAGLVWEMDPTDGHALVIRVAAALRGDYNANGVVDAADYVVWRSQSTRSGRGLAADGTGPDGSPDGVVDDLDYALWRANFGAALPESVKQAAGVPEPGCVSLAALAILIAFTSRCIGLRSHQPGQRTGRG
jgi:hypothetical protein